MSLTMSRKRSTPHPLHLVKEKCREKTTLQTSVFQLNKYSPSCILISYQKTHIISYICTNNFLPSKSNQHLNGFIAIHNKLRLLWFSFCLFWLSILWFSTLQFCFGLFLFFKWHSKLIYTLFVNWVQPASKLKTWLFSNWSWNTELGWFLSMFFFLRIILLKSKEDCLTKKA